VSAITWGRPATHGRARSANASPRRGAGRRTRVMRRGRLRATDVVQPQSSEATNSTSAGSSTPRWTIRSSTEQVLLAEQVERRQRDLDALGRQAPTPPCPRVDHVPGLADRLRQGRHLEGVVDAAGAKLRGRATTSVYEPRRHRLRLPRARSSLSAARSTGPRSSAPASTPLLSPAVRHPHSRSRTAVADPDVGRVPHRSHAGTHPQPSSAACTGRLSADEARIAAATAPRSARRSRRRS